MHVHLRDGQMCDLVTPTVKEGGINVAYIMPNLQPPVTTIEQVKTYKSKLESLSPNTKFLMSFYLNEDITPELLDETKTIFTVLKPTLQASQPTPKTVLIQPILLQF